MKKNTLRYSGLLFSSILMFVFYQNCETAELEIADKATISGSEESDLSKTVACTQDEEVVDGKCISTLLACDDHAHMSRWFEVGPNQMEVKRYCNSTMDFVNDIHEELVEFECSDGVVSELGNTKAGSRIIAVSCPDAKKACNDKKDGDVWWVETEDLIYKTIQCSEGDDVQNSYSKMLEYRCDDGDVSTTGKVEFGTLKDKSTCLEDMRSCGTRSHNSIFYVNSDSVSKIRVCESGDKVKDYYHLQEQFKCDDGSIYATGDFMESSEPYRSSVCPTVNTNCGSRIHGEKWYLESTELISEEVNCSFGTKTRTYYKEYEYSCNSGTQSKTGKHKIGRLHKLGMCPEADCDGYQEGEIYLKNIGEKKDEKIACSDSSAFEVRRYDVESEFKCQAGKSSQTGNYSKLEEYDVATACPIIQKCGADMYRTSPVGACLPVGNGYFSPDDSNLRVSCTNKPENSVYTSSGNGNNSCSFSCDSNYSKNAKDGNLCVKQVCQPGAKLSCNIKNGFAQKHCSDDGLSIDKVCKVITCEVDYYQLGEKCVPVGNGAYSPNNSKQKISCTNGPANSKYTSDGNGKNACAYSCKTGYAKKGNSCQKQICNPDKAIRCAIDNGVGSKVCESTGLSFGSCAVTTCGADFYKVGEKCVPVGVGYYSTSTSTSRVKCTNAPASSTYTSSGKGKNACAHSCNSGYSKSGNICKKHICKPSEIVNCSVSNGSGAKACSSDGLSHGSCEVSACGVDFYKVGNSCVPVGTGFYSSGVSTTRFNCTNAPQNTIYSTSGEGTNSCQWSCSEGHRELNGKCVTQQEYDTREVTGNVTVTYRDFSGANEFCIFNISSEVLTISSKSTKRVGRMNSNAACQQYILQQLQSDYSNYNFKNFNMNWAASFLKNGKKSSQRVFGTIKINRKVGGAVTDNPSTGGGGVSVGGGGFFNENVNLK